MHQCKKIVFRHGLGFVSEFWQPILPFFANHNCVIVEEHYFNQGTSKFIRPDDCDFEVGIGHSLGFWKLCQTLPNAKYLIGINAFTDFLGSSHQLRSSRTVEYEAFKSNLQKFPEGTLKKFYKRCGVNFNAVDFSDINRQNLLTDLTLLTQQVKIDDRKKILMIYAEDDPIVPTSIVEDNFLGTNVKMHCLSKGKHGLGFLHPKTVSEVILDFIK